MLKAAKPTTLPQWTEVKPLAPVDLVMNISISAHYGAVQYGGKNT